jgi:hypothetical protein
MPHIVWPILWIIAMLSLVIVTLVAALREKKSRAQAASQYAAPAMPMDMQAAADDGQPVDLFGAPDNNQVAFDDPFK